MASETAASIGLQERIRFKHFQVDRYLARVRPRKRLYLNVSLVGGSLSALLTAGPALGGKSLSDWLTASFGLDGPAWRLLCAVAALASFAAALATQLSRSHGLEENLTKAQMTGAKLEILELGLTTGQMDEKQALTEYIRCLEAVAFLQGEA